MDELIVEAVRQGWRVMQTKRGTWVFSKGILSATFVTPTTPGQWASVISQLMKVGLDWPPPDRHDS